MESVVLHSHRAPQALIVAVRKGDGSDVNLDDCASFSQAFGEALETGELLTGAYVLEITSPGLGDVLQQDAGSGDGGGGAGGGVRHGYLAMW